MEFLSDVGGGEDLHRPSFFELAAQDQLRDLLAPVVRYVLSVFAQRNPRYLLRIVNRHDEFFALVMLFVERHYLKTWGASFAENFYGLKRRRVLPGGGDDTCAAVALTGRSDKLRAREVRLSLVFLILVPYLRAKAQDWYERLGGGADSDLFRDSPQAHAAQQQGETLPLRARVATAVREGFKKGYPWANTAYELYLLSYNIRYLFGHTPHWRPWLSWMGVEVRRMTQDDYRAAQTATQSLLQSPFRPLPSGLPASYATIAARAAALVPLASFEALKVALPTSIFFFRFLEWWYSPEGGHARLRRRGGGSLGNEGPPLRAPRKPPAPRGEGGRERVPKAGECCVPGHGSGGELVNATALPTGWVGCYKCVHGWVEERGSCPVTGVKVEVGQLRKVMG